MQFTLTHNVTNFVLKKGMHIPYAFPPSFSDHPHLVNPNVLFNTFTTYYRFIYSIFCFHAV